LFNGLSVRFGKSTIFQMVRCLVARLVICTHFTHQNCEPATLNQILEIHLGGFDALDDFWIDGIGGNRWAGGLRTSFNKLGWDEPDTYESGGDKSSGDESGSCPEHRYGWTGWAFGGRSDARIAARQLWIGAGGYTLKLAWQTGALEFLGHLVPSVPCRNPKVERVGAKVPETDHHWCRCRRGP
jgi:acetoin utilization deacetylase AcuC-like enzyme